MRSWVDPLSNSVVLPPALVEDHLPDLMSAIIPPQFLASFAHELCHHWCFQSGAGTSAAITFMRAVQEALRDGGVGTRLATDLLARYEALDLLLRPLIEGLALFAEFDARCGTAPEASVPLSWTALVALPILEDMGEVNVFDHAATVMRDPRYTLVRKETLLTTPCDASVSPYLIGYLAVKATWLQRFALSEGEETDAFLMLAFVHLLNDYELVHAICSTEITAETAITIMAERVDAVMEALADPCRTPLAPLWEERAGGEAAEGGITYGLIWLPRLSGMDEALHEKAITALRGAYERLASPGEGEEDLILARVFETVLHRRQFVTTGRADVLLERDPDGIVRLRTAGYDLEWTEPSWIDAEGSAGPATLELLLFPAASAAVTVLFQQGAVVGTLVVSQGDRRFLEGFAEHAVSTANAMGISEVLTAALGSRTDGERRREMEPTVDAARKRVLEALERAIVQIVGAAAMPSLRKDGFWSICGKELASLRALALASLERKPGVSDGQTGGIADCLEAPSDGLAESGRGPFPSSATWPGLEVQGRFIALA